MSANVLNLAVPPQEQSNWCWAATALGVIHYFDPGKAGLKQCDVVNRRLGVANCCGGSNGGLPVGCNVQSGLTLPLYEAGHHRVTFANKLQLQDIIDEIEVDLPLCVRVVWDQGFGEGHFAVIVGYILDTDGNIADVVIQDSIYGPSIHTFEAFRKFYRTEVQTDTGETIQAGLWTHSYFTQAVIDTSAKEGQAA